MILEPGSATDVDMTAMCRSKESRGIPSGSWLDRQWLLEEGLSMIGYMDRGTCIRVGCWRVGSTLR